MTTETPPKVGYMNPPENTRFKKGKSGNPRGRPRKREGLNTVLQRVLKRKVRVKDKEQNMPIRDALMWKLRDLALHGDKQALALQRRILFEAGFGAREPDPPFDTKAKALEICDRLGIPAGDLRKTDDE